MTRKNTRGTFTILDTDILNFVDNYSYEEFKEWYTDIRNNGIKIPCKDSKEYENWVAEENNGEWDYDSFVEALCEEYDIERVPDEDSREFWDWASDERDAIYETDRDNIEGCKVYNVPVVITGALGLWDGRHSIVPVRCESVIDAIDRCNSDSILDIKVVFNEGHLEVYAGHHDGTNCFEIYALSKKGIARFDKAEERYEDVEELKPTDVKRLPYLYAIGVC